MSASLVGSEMCIRDRANTAPTASFHVLFGIPALAMPVTGGLLDALACVILEKPTVIALQPSGARPAEHARP
eukprot:8167045-Alexandrium_andersonii.AAC.1